MAGAATTGGSGAAAERSSMSAIGDVAKLLKSNYRETTPKRLRMLDMFLVFVFATGVLQVRTSRCFRFSPVLVLFHFRSQLSLTFCSVLFFFLPAVFCLSCCDCSVRLCSVPCSAVLSRAVLCIRKNHIAVCRRQFR